jgi:4-carboxymuconolactone decarboxylase
MARVGLIEENEHPELAELIGKFKGGRGGRLLNVYKLLLNAPTLANSWFEHVSAVRWKTELDGITRELVIIRIGYLTRVKYVLSQHMPTYALQEGMTIEQCDALADWESSNLFDDRQRAILAYTDSMTRDIQVPSAIFNAVRAYFDEHQIVELSVLIGTYNMHVRVLQALEIDLEGSTPAASVH